MSAEAAAGEPAESARESVSPKAVRPRLWWVPKTLLFTLFGAAIWRARTRIQKSPQLCSQCEELPLLINDNAGEQGAVINCKGY